MATVTSGERRLWPVLLSAWPLASSPRVVPPSRRSTTPVMAGIDVTSLAVSGVTFSATPPISLLWMTREVSIFMTALPPTSRTKASASSALRAMSARSR